MDLTRRMSLPRLWVDPNTKVSLWRMERSVAYKWRVASSLEVAALSPEDIKRVEYHDNPACDMGKESISSWII